MSSAKRAKSVDNPFEARHNKSLKFNVLGRRVKGADRNVAAARSRALERREKVLAPEMMAMKKANAFRDRRFGENDQTLDDDTKLLVRLQKERRRQMKQSSKRTKYNLNDDGGGTDTLTHFGKSLSDMSAFEDFRPTDESDEEDGAVDARLTEAHFGGGASGEDMPSWRGKAPLPAWANSESVPEGGKKSYKEIMDEIIAKSKAGKAERAAEKAEQTFMLQRLDMQTDGVVAALMQRAAAVGETSTARAFASQEPAKPFAPLPPSARETAKPAAATDDFDALLHTLAKQSRAAAATDRTLTAEEAEKAEAQRLQELETLRRERMQGESDGKAAADITGGDDLGPDYTGGLTYKQRRRAAGGASILDYAKKEEEEEEQSDDEDDEEDDESEDDENEDDDGEDDEDDEDEDLLSDEEMGGRGIPSEESEGDEQPTHIKAAARSKQSAASTAAGDEESMPFVLAAPQSLEQWQSLVEAYCTSTETTARASQSGMKRKRNEFNGDTSRPVWLSDQLSEMIRRIRACNSVKVDASNRDKLAKFYRVLIQDVRSQGNKVDAAPKKDYYEAVFTHLFAMSQEGSLQKQAAGVWREELQRIHERVSEHISNGSLGEKSAMGSSSSASSGAVARASPAWLTSGEYILLTMALRLFPLSDFRHVIITAAALLLSNSLQNTVIVNEMDLARGIGTAALLMQLCAGGRRFAPELVYFIHSVASSICGVTPRSNAGKRGEEEAGTAIPPQPSFRPFAEACRDHQATVRKALNAVDSSTVQTSRIPLSFFSKMYTISKREASEDMPAFTTVMQSCFASYLSLVEQAVHLLVPQLPLDAKCVRAATSPGGDAAKALLHGLKTTPMTPLTHMKDAPFPCAPEILEMIGSSLGNLAKLVSGAAKARCVSVLEKCASAKTAVAEARLPLTLHESSAVRSIRQYAPLVEDVNAPHVSAFAAKKPEDVAAAEAREEVRKLQKAKKRELRGAMRELRIDREFIVRKTDEEKAKREMQRTNKYNEVMSFLQTQQATFKQMVRKSSKPSSDDAKAAPISVAKHTTKADRRARKAGPK